LRPRTASASTATITVRTVWHVEVLSSLAGMVSSRRVRT
jgi:hypothetical protein